MPFVRSKIFQHYDLPENTERTVFRHWSNQLSQSETCLSPLFECLTQIFLMCISPYMTELCFIIWRNVSCLTLYHFEVRFTSVHLDIHCKRLFAHWCALHQCKMHTTVHWSPPPPKRCVRVVASWELVWGIFSGKKRQWLMQFRRDISCNCLLP